MVGIIGEAVTLKCVATGAGATFVIAKFAVSAPTLATTLYEPAVPLAVRAGAVAMPLPFVTTVALAAKVPEAPEAGAVKVTLTPASGLLPESVTLACSAVLKAVLTFVL